MTRELKFRAWVKENKEWLYTDLEITEYDFCRNEIWLDYEDCTSIEQYTGLKDKNGKEIYEGDIIDYNSDGQSIWYVKYNAPHYELIDEYGFTMFLEDSPHQTIIGNIHENPELLKGES